MMTGNAPLQPTRLEMPDADVVYFPAIFSTEECLRYFQSLSQVIQWTQDAITMYGRKIYTPRLTAWYGDSGTKYTYSGIAKTAIPWTSELLQIKERLEPLSNTVFNSVLLNLYRDGNDSVAWHSDNEPELGTNPTIGSVSFGETRRFQFKHKQAANRRISIALTDGSFLLMRGPTQHHWVHQVPKSKSKINERINLTFRVIY
ncbi:MAG: alpha-ketoglutarate-dependent dioxygenase AlkB [Planctomycetota bacterium]|nr:alpha-ketoglutarate-dependent dioxygenase AlkB [Planctomycetota bacterium]MDA1178106.1 alpha-ketoglutarate-dependent dioxygenase AlkB [Planctomycetota bacterium]